MQTISIALLCLVAFLFFLGCTAPPVACTQEAKLCPDGSAVGRTLPNCEFAACPGAIAPNAGTLDCNSFSVDTCPSQCAICPPCAECSSISCNEKSFCKGIGFDENWYASVKQK